MNPGRIAFVAALALSIACGTAEAPKTASDAALQVFELAKESDPDPADLDALFAGVGVSGNRRSADRRAALYDALEYLRPAGGIRVTAAQGLEGLGVTAVDLVGDLPGGGQATYSVHLEPVEDGSWRVTWFAGPGVDWPERSRGRGSGLSTSNPPSGPRTR